MQIQHEWPPNIEEIKKKFDLLGLNPVFTYGAILYNPLGLPISDDLMVHEQVHGKQQSQMGPDNWWKLYLEDKKFRLEQETEAYRAQAKFADENYNRKSRKIIAKELVRHLSSKLYGNLITKKEAKQLIYE